MVRSFGLNRGTGGAGRQRGGDGVVRELLFRKPMTLSILSERRVHHPYGLRGTGILLLVASLIWCLILSFPWFKLRFLREILFLKNGVLLETICPDKKNSFLNLSFYTIPML